jgi:hypothetical protein
MIGQSFTGSPHRNQPCISTRFKSALVRPDSADSWCSVTSQCESKYSRTISSVQVANMVSAFPFSAGDKKYSAQPLTNMRDKHCHHSRKSCLGLMQGKRDPVRLCLSYALCLCVRGQR